MSSASSTRCLVALALALAAAACSSDATDKHDAQTPMGDGADVAAPDGSSQPADAAEKPGDAALLDSGQVITDGAAAPDAAVNPAPGDTDANTDGAASRGQPVFVAVGYAGRRVRSTDLGRTWVDDQSLGGGGDDMNLLRAVAFGDGVFVAVGWRIFSSPDGSTQSWTERTMQGQQWLGGIAYGNRRFVATGGYGTSAWSSDGLTWQAGGSLNTEASRSLAFGAESFVSATDDGHWWNSADGGSWSLLSADHTSSQIAYCSGGFRNASECAGAFTSRDTASGEGVTVRVRDGHIERSVEGQAFTTVLNGGSPLESVAFGYASR